MGRGGKLGEKSFDQCFRSAVAVRIATIVVLFISDLDIVFSFLFARELFIIGGIYRFFWGVLGVGSLTYIVGIGYFGPQNKFGTVKQIHEMMSQQPQQFKGFPDARGRGPAKQVMVTGDSSTNPANASRWNTDRKFKDLEPDADGYDEMRLALSRYKLSHLWTYADRCSSLNTCEIKHGMPFLRLARFGFMAQPSPRDLGSILNTNALYSFCTGIFQLVIGGILIAETSTRDMFILLPFGISASSFVLSACNMLLDFSGTLYEIESERSTAAEILDKLESERKEEQKSIDETFKDRVAEIQIQFGGNMEASLQTTDKLYELLRSHQLALREAEHRNRDKLGLEITMYRERLAFTKQATAFAGAAEARFEELPRGQIQELQDQLRPFEDQQRKVEGAASTRISALDSAALSPDDLDMQMKKINTDTTEKLEILKKQITGIRFRFTDHRAEVGDPQEEIEEIVSI